MAMDLTKPTQQEVWDYLHKDRNWGRWGADDQLGAVNLISEQKRVDAARLVQSGVTVSLSRPFPNQPQPGNSRPAEQVLYRSDKPNDSGAAGEYLGIRYHGYACTHIDAICHWWDSEGMWGGRDPDSVLSSNGSSWADIDKLSGGIVTRGILLDVPRFRGEASVTLERPVHGAELEAVAEAEGVQIRPGDALAVYSGREKWSAAHPEWHGEQPARPGLHASCLPFIRKNDVSVVCWDLMDAQPIGDEYDLPVGMHGVLFAYGVPLVDNCLLEPLADTCAEQKRYEFLLVIAPLRIVGGTGSPANPIAVF
jgi:kynurenine formamidase